MNQQTPRDLRAYQLAEALYNIVQRRGSYMGFWECRVLKEAGRRILEPEPRINLAGLLLALAIFALGFAVHGLLLEYGWL